jgi:hypothetical protein
MEVFCVRLHLSTYLHVLLHGTSNFRDEQGRKLFNHWKDFGKILNFDVNANLSGEFVLFVLVHHKTMEMKRMLFM